MNTVAIILLSLVAIIIILYFIWPCAKTKTEELLVEVLEGLDTYTYGEIVATMRPSKEELLAIIDETKIIDNHIDELGEYKFFKYSNDSALLNNEFEKVVVRYPREFLKLEGRHFFPDQPNTHRYFVEFEDEPFCISLIKVSDHDRDAVYALVVRKIPDEICV